MVNAVKVWHRLLAPGAPLFGSLTLSRYTRAIAWAAEHTNLAHLHLVPHSVRHGGASADFVLGARTIQEIKARGLWRDDRSVARYKKPALYNSQLAKMTQEQCDLAHQRLAWVGREIRKID